MHTLSCEFGGDRGADASIRAGSQRNLAGRIQFQVPP
jgi:hypothetical protein